MRNISALNRTFQRLNLVGKDAAEEDEPLCTISIVFNCSNALIYVSIEFSSLLYMQTNEIVEAIETHRRERERGGRGRNGWKSMPNSGEHEDIDVQDTDC